MFFVHRHRDRGGLCFGTGNRPVFRRHRPFERRARRRVYGNPRSVVSDRGETRSAARQHGGAHGCVHRRVFLRRRYACGLRPRPLRRDGSRFAGSDCGDTRGSARRGGNGKNQAREHSAHPPAACPAARRLHQKRRARFQRFVFHCQARPLRGTCLWAEWSSPAKAEN